MYLPRLSLEFSLLGSVFTVHNSGFTLEFWVYQIIRAKKALLDHLSLVWPSPYLKNIFSIKERVNLTFDPPTLRYLGKHLYQWSLAETNNRISQLHLPYVGSLPDFSRQPYVFEHAHLTTIAEFRLSSAGLGNKYPRFAGVLYERQKFCPLCPGAILTEAHVIFFCSAIEHHRRHFNLHLYRTSRTLKGLDQEGIMEEYLNSYDWEKDVHRSECVSLGHVLDTLRGHWLSLW